MFVKHVYLILNLVCSIILSKQTNLNRKLYILGLPVQVRDEALQVTDTIPKGQVNKEFFTQNAEAEVKKEKTKVMITYYKYK